VADELVDVLGLVIPELERKGEGPAANLAHVLRVVGLTSGSGVARRDVVLQMIFLERLIRLL